VDIDSLAFGGDGVGRDPDGRVIFVEGAAPGDRVEVEIVETKKGYARGTIARLLTPSPHRIDPPCPIFVEGECGGCQWQHVDVETQRAAKQDIVARALRHVMGEGVLRPIETPSPAFGWRRRARMRWRGVRSESEEPGSGSGSGSIRIIGYQARRSHKLVDVPACPQLEPALDAALPRARAAVLEQSASSGELHLLLGGRGDVHIVLSPSNPTSSPSPSPISSPPIDLADDPDGVPFLASADVFAQVSARGNDTLRRLVRDAAGPTPGRVLELYAGSGNFTRDLARVADRVVAIEESPPAVSLAEQNLAARNLDTRVIFLRSGASASLDSFSAGDFDLAVVDPPRTGLEPGVASSLVRLAPRTLIYVSCDPPTLARDLRTFVDSGWRVDAVTPVDLMPQTFHIEVVAVAHRAG
jgi:23S rRNA (uracil1939-C5)-methyltransferase